MILYRSELIYPLLLLLAQYLDTAYFAGTEELDMGILTSQQITSAATAMSVFGGLDRASNRVHNVVTILHVTEDGDISQAKIAMCVKT